MKRWIKSPCHTLLFIPLLCWHAEALVSHPLNCTLRLLFLVFQPKASQVINSPALSIITWSKGRLKPGTPFPLALVLAYLGFLGVVACGLLIEWLRYCKRADWNQLEINPLDFSLSLNSSWCCHLLPLVLFLLYWHVGSWHGVEGRWERRDTSAPSRSCYRMERNQPSWQDVRTLCRIPVLVLLM